MICRTKKSSGVNKRNKVPYIHNYVNIHHYTNIYMYMLDKWLAFSLIGSILFFVRLRDIPNNVEEDLFRIRF